MKKIAAVIFLICIVILLVQTWLNITYIDRVVVASFPVYPGSVYTGKTISPGCLNKTTEQPGCVERRYQWQVNTSIASVQKWFTENLTKASWQCSPTSRQLLPEEKLFIYFDCIYNSSNYQILISPKSAGQTAIILIVNSAS